MRAGRLPFSVLLSTPVAILGAYLALAARSLENDIFATVGLIMLIGLSAKNAILIVEFAVQNYRSGQSIAESALHAARVRFRPIVMTALAFIVGCIPLWTASGAGAVSRRILGTVVIGGMSLATVIGHPHGPDHLLRRRVPVASFRSRGEGNHDGFHSSDPQDAAAGPAAYRTRRRSRHEPAYECPVPNLSDCVRRFAVCFCWWAARSAPSTSARKCPLRLPSGEPTTPQVTTPDKTSLGDQNGPRCFANRSCRT